MHLFQADQLSNAQYLDLSGLESLTDFSLRNLCKCLKQNEKLNGQIKFNEIKLSACRFITVWSLQYMMASCGKSILDLHNSEINQISVRFKLKYLNVF